MPLGTILHHNLTRMAAVGMQGCRKPWSVGLRIMVETESKEQTCPPCYKPGRRLQTCKAGKGFFCWKIFPTAANPTGLFYLVSTAVVRAALIPAFPPPDECGGEKSICKERE